MVAGLRTLTIGDPLDEATDIGSLASEQQFDMVCSYIRSATAHGARLVTGGPGRPVPGDGLYLAPTVITGAEESWPVAREEVFGPVMVVLPWRDEADVVARANDSRYGLAGYVWTKDLSAALRVAHALEAGWVQVNRGGGQLPGMSYGGNKQSGQGREYSLGGALDSFTQVKSITVAL